MRIVTPTTTVLQSNTLSVFAVAMATVSTHEMLSKALMSYRSGLIIDWNASNRTNCSQYTDYYNATHYSPCER